MTSPNAIDPMPPPRKCKRMMRIPDKTILIEDSLPYGMDTSDTLNLPESEMQTLMNKFKEDPGDLVQKFATPPAPKFKPVAFVFVVAAIQKK